MTKLLHRAPLLLGLSLAACAGDPTHDDVGGGGGKADDYGSEALPPVSAIDVEQETFANPILFDDFLPVFEEQVRLADTMWTTAQGATLLETMARESAARGAALMVSSYGTAYSRAGDRISGEYHLGEYAGDTGVTTPLATVVIKQTLASGVTTTVTYGATTTTGKLPAVDVDQNLLGSPVSADVFLRNRVEQRAMLNDLYGASEVQAELEKLARAASNEDAVILVRSAGATRSRTGGMTRGEVHLAKYTLDGEIEVAGALLFRRLDGATSVQVKRVP